MRHGRSGDLAGLPWECANHAVLDDAGHAGEVDQKTLLKATRFVPWRRLAALRRPAHWLASPNPNTAPSTSLTGPGGAFDFQFLVPASVANSTPPTSPFFITAPILSGSYTFGGSTDSVFSGTYLFANSGGNQTDIDLIRSVGDIHLSSAPLIGHPVLADRPDASGQSHFLTGNLETGVFATIDLTPASGNSFTVDGTTVSIVGASVPEPSGIGLMAVGLLTWGGVTLLCHTRAARWHLSFGAPINQP